MHTYKGVYMLIKKLYVSIFIFIAGFSKIKCKLCKNKSMYGKMKNSASVHIKNSKVPTVITCLTWACHALSFPTLDIFYVFFTLAKNSLLWSDHVIYLIPISCQLSNAYIWTCSTYSIGHVIYLTLIYTHIYIYLYIYIYVSYQLSNTYIWLWYMIMWPMHKHTIYSGYQVIYIYSIAGLSSSYM